MQAAAAAARRQGGAVRRSACCPSPGCSTARATNALGPNPAEALIRGTGDWVLRFLCLTLAVTPLRQLSGWPALARFRRMLGLFSFFYLVLHFLSYAWLDMGFDLRGHRARHPEAPVRPRRLRGLRC